MGIRQHYCVHELFFVDAAKSYYGSIGPIEKIGLPVNHIFDSYEILAVNC